MKQFFWVVFCLHVLMEAVVGLLVMFTPMQMAPGASADGLPFIINFGASGITIALMAAWFWPHRHNPAVLSITLGVFATFHTAQTAAGMLIASHGGGINVIVSHGAFAVCFWWLWLKRHALLPSASVHDNGEVEP